MGYLGLKKAQNVMHVLLSSGSPVTEAETKPRAKVLFREGKMEQS